MLLWYLMGAVVWAPHIPIVLYALDSFDGLHLPGWTTVSPLGSGGDVS